MVAEFGDETDAWIGARVTIRSEEVAGLRGRLQDAVTVTPLGQDAPEVKKGKK
jgi:hypothetical protein